MATVPPNAKFFSTVTSVGGLPLFHLNFVDTMVPRQIAQSFANACAQNIVFGEIDGVQLRAVAKIAHVKLWTVGAQTPDCLDIFQAQSIYRHVVSQYNIDNFARLATEANEMAREYDDGMSILDISAKHKLSPYAIFKVVIPSEINRQKLNYLAVGKIRATDVFTSARDIEQYEIAQKYDFSSVSAQLKLANESQAREDNFVKILRNIGIQLKTQSELFDEAMKAGNHPITPDVLFLNNVSVNGMRVKWIDFKAYFGGTIPFINTSLRKQYKKYAQTFGPGLFAFEHGFVAGLPNAISVRALRDIIDENTR